MGKREHQYERFSESMLKRQFHLGSMLNDAYLHDPKRITFTASRYKFVSKMLSGYENVLEIGCGDGFMSRIVLQEVAKLDLTDFDSSFVEEAKDFYGDDSRVRVFMHDFTENSLTQDYDAVYALDVIEHINPISETVFMKNLCKSIKKTGVGIFGIPSLQSQMYASEISKRGHVNCKSGDDFKKSLQEYFTQVFIFSMNDEVVHTGFTPMAQYLLAICTNPRTR